MIDCPTISACLIVKNEAKNLARCLASIVDLVDELIVVDTGSDDETISIAEAYGAQVTLSPWQDDFSFHRNESFAQASSEWILRIDADEELFLLDTHEAFLKELFAIDEKTVMTRNMMEDIQSGRVAAIFPQYHFFRRGVTYANRKHNRPVFDGPCFHLKTVKTRHYGYDPAFVAGKKERDLFLLDKMVAEDPENAEINLWKAQALSHYAKEYNQALFYLEKYIDLAADTPEFNQSAYVLAHTLAKEVGAEEQAQTLFLKAFEKDPQSVDVSFIRVRLAAAARDGEAVETACQAYLSAYEKLKRNPSLLDGRFLYYFQPDALVYVLHKATVCHLYRGYSYLSLFEKYIGQASPRAAQGMKTAMAIDLKNILPSQGAERAA